MLKLTPHLTAYLWGGNRLLTEFNYTSTSEIAAEAWVVSTRPEGNSIDQFGQKLSNSTGIDFPLLIKFIDAEQNLSIQVHPGDRINGKTEMWYVLDAVPNAKIAYGWNQKMTPESISEAVISGKLEEFINYEPVAKGDAIFVPAGTVHGIGAGILIAEVQQNSNTTYRLYDYNRVGADGKSRELHVQSAISVMKMEKQAKLEQNWPVQAVCGGVLKEVSSCQFFSVYEGVIDGCLRVENEGFSCVLVLEGDVGVCGEAGKKGDSYYFPGGMKWEVSGKGLILIGQVQKGLNVEVDGKMVGLFGEERSDAQ